MTADELVASIQDVLTDYTIGYVPGSDDDGSYLMFQVNGADTGGKFRQSDVDAVVAHYAEEVSDEITGIMLGQVSHKIYTDEYGATDTLEKKEAFAAWAVSNGADFDHTMSVVLLMFRVEDAFDSYIQSNQPELIE